MRSYVLNSRGWFLSVAVVCAVVTAPLFAGEVIDRIVATVNSDVVLESDLDQTTRFEALAGGSALRPMSAEEREARLQRLIDQELLLQQMRRSGYRAATETEIAASLKDLRSRVAGAQSQTGWEAALAAVGLTVADVKEQLAKQIEVMRFVDQRFRPGIRIDNSEITKYYDEVLTPELKARSLAPPPIKEVSPKIEEILVQRSIEDQLSSWLKSLRSESEIRLLPADPSLEAGAH